MKKFSVMSLAVLGILYLAAMVVPVDPEERRPGTRLSGELAAEQNPDWSQHKSGDQIFVQTSTWYFVPHSVTTIAWAEDGELYVPCRACDTKLWPENVARDPIVRIKVGGKLYERRAERVTDAMAQRRLLNVPHHGEMPDVAVYRMARLD